MGTNAVNIQLNNINNHVPLVLAVQIKDFRESAQLMIDIAVLEQEEQYLNSFIGIVEPFDLYLLGSLFKYVPDKNVQTYKTPLGLLISEQGNCVASSIFILAVLIKNNTVNKSTKLVFGGFKKDKPVHVWIEHNETTIDLVHGRTEEKNKFIVENFAKTNSFPYLAKINIL